jgi:hypothetical protein
MHKGEYVGGKELIRLIPKTGGHKEVRIDMAEVAVGLPYPDRCIFDKIAIARLAFPKCILSGLPAGITRLRDCDRPGRLIAGLKFSLLFVSFIHPSIFIFFMELSD